MDAPQESVQISNQESFGTQQTKSETLRIYTELAKPVIKNAQLYPKICMLDIETLDTAPTAKILSLGAVDVYGKDTWYQEFASRSYDQYGRTTSTDTLSWWASQTNMPKGDVDLKLGLESFSQWYQQYGFTEVWCKGTDFDFVILSHAYKSMDVETPWKYHHVRDLRTLIKVFPNVKSPAPYSNHHALVDVICQAQHLKEILSYVNRKIWSHSVIQGLSGAATGNNLR